MTRRRRLFWFRFNAVDFTGETAGWPPNAVCALIRLLAAAWVQEGLPDDDDVLCRITGLTPKQWRAVWPLVEPKFPIGRDGRRINPEMEDGRAEAIKLAKINQARSKKASRARWGKLSLVRSPERSSEESSEDPHTHTHTHTQESVVLPPPDDSEGGS